MGKGQYERMRKRGMSKATLSTNVYVVVRSLAAWAAQTGRGRAKSPQMEEQTSGGYPKGSEQWLVLLEVR